MYYRFFVLNIRKIGFYSSLQRLYNQHFQNYYNSFKVVAICLVF